MIWVYEVRSPVASPLEAEWTSRTRRQRPGEFSNISKVDYPWSRLSTDEVKYRSGGIRKILFGTNNGLTKAPLVFVDSRIQLFKDWHHAENAHIANFTCALLHYPFTSSFYDKVRDAAATKRYGHLTSDEYDRYWRRLSAEPELCMRLETSRRYSGIESLLNEGFLVASPDYLDWVDTEQKRLTLNGTPVA